MKQDFIESPAIKAQEKFERVFVAIPVGTPTSTDITQIYDERPHFRWSDEENLHLTLRFVGEVDEALKEAISAKLEEIVVEPFILPVEKIGAFPTRGQPQVVYAGLGSAHTRLFQLQHRVEEALAGLGLPLELRAFSPHITLARVSRCNPMTVNDFVKRHRDFVAAPFKVERFCLYKTQMTHFGAQYTCLREYSLKSKQAKAV